MDMDTSLPRQTISSSLQAQTVYERRRAIAALLRRPLLTPGEKGAADFILVRRHAAWLREWFMRHCQWTLHVESELARLRKTPGELNDSTRPLLQQGAAIRAAAVRGAVSGAGSAGEIRVANGAAAVGGCHRRRVCCRSAVGPQRCFL